MRRLLVAVALLALPAVGAEEDPYRTLVDWQEGRALAPTTPFASLPLAETFAFTVEPCFDVLLLDLLYAPDETTVAAEGVGTVAIAHEFRIEVWHEGERAHEQRVKRSGYGTPLGRASEAGDHEIRLSLGWGADVAWEMRLRARFAYEDPACNPPL